MATTCEQRTDGSEQAAGSDRCWLWRTWWLVGGLLVFRLVYAAIVPLDLVPDEAYYWDWSRQLDWGYYSKPPMVAWLIALSTSWAGSTALVVRLPAVLLGTLGLFWMYLLAGRMYGRKAGFWAVLLTAATPGNAALALLMTIDAPFLFCWCATLYCFWRFLEGGRTQGIWLAAATLTTGLGLLSKQSMFGFLPLAFVFLVVSPADRRQLRGPRVWVWVVASLLFLAPVVIWNMHHDWITAQHTSGHFTSAGWDAETAFPVWRIPGRTIRRRYAVDDDFVCHRFGPGRDGLPAARPPARYLFCFSGLPMAGVLCLALVQYVQPNWPAGFVPAGFVLVCGWALGQVPGIRPLKEGSRDLRRSLVVGAACVLVAYLLPFGFGLQGSKIDPAARLRGWRELGQAVDAAWRELPQSQQAFLITTAGRAAASELAFYLPAQPRAYVWNETGRILSQYDVLGRAAKRPRRHRPDCHQIGKPPAGGPDLGLRHGRSSRRGKHPDRAGPGTSLSALARYRFPWLAERRTLTTGGPFSGKTRRAAHGRISGPSDHEAALPLAARSFRRQNDVLRASVLDQQRTGPNEFGAMHMLIGIISKILADKGIGFITPSDERGDVFFHASVVVGEQFEQLKEGQAVAFDLERTKERRDRPRAAKVTPCDEKLLGRRAADEPPPSRHPRARRRKPTWRD